MWLQFWLGWCFSWCALSRKWLVKSLGTYDLPGPCIVVYPTDQESYTEWSSANPTNSKSGWIVLYIQCACTNCEKHWSETRLLGNTKLSSSWWRCFNSNWYLKCSVFHFWTVPWIPNVFRISWSAVSNVCQNIMMNCVKCSTHVHGCYQGDFLISTAHPWQVIVELGQQCMWVVCPVRWLVGWWLRCNLTKEAAWSNPDIYFALEINVAHL